MLSGPLQNLAMWALQQNDFANAETWFFRSYEVNQKTYGENSQGTADSLRGLAHDLWGKPEKVSSLSRAPGFACRKTIWTR
jgi:Tetratricopeptide repeat